MKGVLMMQWTSLPVRLPADVLGQLEEQLQTINRGHSVPVSLNELVVEILRSCCSNDLNQGNVPNEAANGQDTPVHISSSGLTLHAAIEQVLKESGRSMRFADIREVIVRRDLYREGNGGPPSHQQIRARVQNYPKLFVIDRSKDPQEVSLEFEYEDE
jgi:hypothetical protein